MARTRDIRFEDFKKVSPAGHHFDMWSLSVVHGDYILQRPDLHTEVWIVEFIDGHHNGRSSFKRYSREEIIEAINTHNNLINPRQGEKR